MVTSKIERVYFMEATPFSNVFSAIAYYVCCNPARAKSLNILEPSGGCRRPATEFSGNHPNDIWVSVCHAVRRTMDSERGLYRAAFRMYYLDPERHHNSESIARALSLSARTVRRKLNKMVALLEDELVRRELLPPPETEMH